MKQKQACRSALVCLYLQSDIGPGQTAAPAEADLHVVKPTVSLGDISDLNVATALRLRFACCQPKRGSDEERMRKKTGAPLTL